MICSWCKWAGDYGSSEVEKSNAHKICIKDQTTRDYPSCDCQHRVKKLKK